jgi:exopolysaccharide biosynthesis protein
MDSHTVSVFESDGTSAAVVSSLGAKSKALAAINASFFDRDKFPTEFVKDEGKILCTRPPVAGTRSNGMFRIQDKKGRKVDILTVEDSTSAFHAAKGWREAIVSGPVLMEDGEVVDYTDMASKTFFYRRHPRTLMGYTADGWIYFIVVDGRFPQKAEGMSIFELQTLCKALGLHEAMNFDGGGSSTLWTKENGVVNHPCDNKTYDHAGERIVPNAIIVK